MKKHKKQKITYRRGDIREVRIVDDFLPPPDQLALKEESVKITLSVTKSSINFFKQAAKAHHTQYQKMIRALLDQYAKMHSE